MNQATRRRLERLLDDLLWLVTDSGVELDPFVRDHVGELRADLDDALEE